MTQYRHAIIIGASSGIGAELARQLSATGCKVIGLGRNMERLQALAASPPGNISVRQHDVKDYASIPQLFQDLTQELGGLDLIIYSSGVMPKIGADEYDFAKDREIIEVNLLGAIAWLDQAAIRFGNTGTGTILAIGSVAGERGRRGQPAYNTSKAALATYMEALRNRLSMKGVKVVTVKPGPVETPLTENTDFKNLLPVEKAAEIILRKAEKNGEHFLLFSHAVIFGIIRNLPSPIIRRMKI
jgi:short-subunit dehydrogenase